MREKKRKIHTWDSRRRCVLSPSAPNAPVVLSSCPCFQQSHILRIIRLKKAKEKRIIKKKNFKKESNTYHSPNDGKPSFRLLHLRCGFAGAWSAPDAGGRERRNERILSPRLSFRVLVVVVMAVVLASSLSFPFPYT
jgi:hypothetical protein